MVHLVYKLHEQLVMNRLSSLVFAHSNVWEQAFRPLDLRLASCMDGVCRR